MAANVGPKEDVYSKKLSYRVLNFASAQGNKVHEVFLFEVYVVPINIYLFDILFIII